MGIAILFHRCTPMYLSGGDEQGIHQVGIRKAEKGTRVYILPTKIGEVEKVTNIDKELINKSWLAIQAKEA